MSAESKEIKTEIKKTKAFWVFIVLGILIFLSAIILSPIWQDMNLFFSSWGSMVVFALIGIAILLYLIFIHSKRFNKNEHNGKVKALNVIEIIVLSIVAIFTITCQFISFGWTDPCHIIGAVLWYAGASHILRAFLKKGTVGSGYLVFTMLIAIFAISFGVFLFLKPIFTVTNLQWMLAIALLIIGICFFVHGCRVKPPAPPKEKAKGQVEESKVK